MRLLGVEVIIGIGSNMGDREENIKRALYLLDGKEGLTLAGVAPLYRTEPVGYTEQDWFLNTVAIFMTELSPEELLAVTSKTEKEIGRKRNIRWGPRVIDLDILLYGELSVNAPCLQIPHPRLLERAFVVVPLADLYPGRLLPGGRTAASLAAELTKSQYVERYVTV